MHSIRPRRRSASPVSRQLRASGAQNGRTCQHLQVLLPSHVKKSERYINDCTICQISKPSHDKTPGLLHPIEAIDPYYTIIMDFITGLPLCRGFDALLTLTDKFSKAIRLIPCKSTISAEETAQLIPEARLSWYSDSPSNLSPIATLDLRLSSGRRS